MPEFKFARFENEWNPIDTSQPYWALNEFPHLAFIPVQPNFAGVLFSRLQGDFQIEGEGSKWRLSPATQRSWESLERALINMTGALLEGKLTPLEFAHFPHPTTFGYMRDHKVKRQAAACAFKSRASFVHLASMCTYAISLHLASVDESVPVWAEVLSDKGVPSAYIEGFRRSIYANFKDVDRIGAVLHPACQWLSDIKTMTALNIPLWFWWGEGDLSAYVGKIGAQHVRNFVPSQQAMDSFKQGLMLLSASTRSAVDLSAFPELPTHSRQRRGENIDEYFKRMDSVRATSIAKESSQVRQSRLDREARSLGKQLTNKNSAAVFVWEQEDEFWVRRKLTRHDAERGWNHYRHEARYDSIHDEWDVCEKFSTDTERDRFVPIDELWDDEEDDIDEDQYYNYQPSTTITPAPPFTPQSPETWSTDLQFAYGAYNTPGLDFTRFVGVPLERILYERYGFTASRSYQCQLQLKGDEFHMTAARRSFGHTSALVSDEALEDSITDFYISLVQAPQLMPRPLLDLNVLDRNDIRVQPLSDHQGKHYILELRASTQGDAPYLIVVKDPLTVLQCHRSGWDVSHQDLVRNLLAAGIPFNTYARRDIPISSCSYRFLGMLPLPAGYQADAYDYSAYEEHLAHWLTEPHARAVLLRGGIAWRLAKQVAGDSLDGFVLSGPSHYAAQSGRLLRIQEKGDYFDDSISQTELDFVCGLYRSPTGKARDDIAIYL